MSADLVFTQISAQSPPPPSGTSSIYFKTDGNPYTMNSSGAESSLVGPTGATGPGVPNGGSTGQVLAKNSSTNQDTGWTDTLSNKTLVAPALGTPTSGVMTNVTGTASGLTAGNVNATSNSTLTTLSALTSASALTTVGALSSGSTATGFGALVGTSLAVSGAAAIGTTPNTSQALTISNALSSSSVSQTGITLNPTFSTSATTQVSSLFINGGTLAGSGTTALSAGIQIGSISTSATITRSIGLLVPQVMLSGTNGACIADNNGFTGSWFINQSNNIASTLGGALTVAGVLTSSANCALTGSSNNVGTITTGTWNAGAVTSSGNILSSAATTGNQSIQVTNTSAGTGNAAQLRGTNDAGRSLRIQYTSSTFSGSVLSGGISGETANILTDGAFGMSIGCNVASAINISSANAVTIVNGVTVGGAVRFNGANVSNGSVACVLTASSGPTGAATSVQGWLQVSISGTNHYIPYW